MDKKETKPKNISEKKKLIEAYSYTSTLREFNRAFEEPADCDEL